VSAVALPVDFWMPASTLLGPQEIVQYTIGYFRIIANNTMAVSVETFYKSLDNLTEFKKGIINSVTKVSMEENIITGKGRSYGVEWLIEKKAGRFKGWLSYTLSRSERIFAEINNGRPYPSKYDRTHDLSVFGQYQINQYWNASAVFVLASGAAVTLPYGRYMIGQNIVNQYMDYNSFRMPVYHRIDIAFSRKLHKRGTNEHSLDFGIYNLYSRLNPIFMYFNVKGDLNSYKLNISPKYVSIFTVLPSVTYHFKF
jgi:hypothetical protein